MFLIPSGDVPIVARVGTVTIYIGLAARGYTIPVIANRSWYPSSLLIIFLWKLLFFRMESLNLLFIIDLINNDGGLTPFDEARPEKEEVSLGRGEKGEGIS